MAKARIMIRGVEFASVDAPDIETAVTQIMHYAQQYASEGDVDVQVRGAGKYRTIARLKAEAPNA